MSCKKWILPLVLLIICILLMSYFVTSSINIKINSVKENFLDQLENPNTKDNLSTEKVDLLLNNIKLYLLSKYPSKKSLVSDNKNISKKWEDLTDNNNNFIWKNEPVYNNGGFETENNILKGDLSKNKFKEITFIIKASLLHEKEPSKENKEVPSKGEILANLDKTKTIKNDGLLKEHFVELMEDLKSGNSQKVDNTLTKMQKELNKQPNKGRIEKSPVAVLLKNKSKENIKLRLPDGSGNFELNINGKVLKNLKRVSTTNKDTYYMVMYKDIDDKTAKIVSFVNNKKIIDEKINKINLNPESIIINPHENLNVLLKEVAVIDKFLDDKEAKYFLRSDIILKTILDKVSTEFKKVNTNNSKHDRKRKSNEKCPSVYIDNDGNYIIHNTSYGSNREVAREIYRINFPGCRKIPKELETRYNRKHLPKNSPFIVNSPFNPIWYHHCDRIDWTDKNANINAKCKRRINNYCEEYAYLDPKCVCWRNEYRESDKCKKFRRKYNDPNDYGCSVSEFSIEEHPDFSKYIRKDKIPCWGCDLT